MDQQPDIRVGDIVRVGKGKKTWRVLEIVTEIETVKVTPYAWLAPIEGYTHNSADLTRLTLLERPGAST